MADPVWGLLSKSAVDPEKVEEAVDRLVAVHNDDETSHLEAGQSLQSHKASEIIDHIAGSIITDKLAALAVTGEKITNDQIVAKDIRTATDVGAGVDGVKMIPSGIEMWQGGVRKVNIPVSGDPTFSGVVEASEFRLGENFYSTDFKTLDDWEQYGTGNTYGYFRLVRIVASGAANVYKVVRLSEYSGPWFDADFYDFYIEFHATVGFPALHEGWAGMNIMQNGFTDEFEPANGFAFKFFNQKVYAVYTEADGTVIATEIMSSIPTGFHTYKITYKKGVYLRFYIDTTLEFELTVSVPDFYSLYTWGFSVDKHAGSGLCEFVIDRLILQRIPI